MNDDSASLDRLHDIVLPTPVSWWPPAPGWVLLAALVLIVAGIAAIRFWLRWKADAYRREALSAVETATDSTTIAVVLRRTALAEFSRSKIASLHGEAWVNWLVATSSEPVPPEVRDQLIRGPYSPAIDQNPAALRRWARRWITAHHPAS